MAEFYDGFEINGVTVRYGKDKPSTTDAALGVIIPSPIKKEAAGFRNVLAQLRIQRDTQDPRQVLEAATQELNLKDTEVWNKMLDGSHGSQKYAAGVSEELAFRAKLARRHASEAKSRSINPLPGLIRYFDVAVAVESVVYGLGQVYRPQTDYRALRDAITANAIRLDGNVGNLPHMYTLLNVCYDRSILKQFGIRGGFTNG